MLRYVYFAESSAMVIMECMGDRVYMDGINYDAEDCGDYLRVDDDVGNIPIEPNLLIIDIDETMIKGFIKRNRIECLYHSGKRIVVRRGNGSDMRGCDVVDGFIVKARCTLYHELEYIVLFEDSIGTVIDLKNHWQCYSAIPLKVNRYNEICIKYNLLISELRHFDQFDLDTHISKCKSDSTAITLAVALNKAQ